MQIPVAEGRYKRQQMTDGFGRLSGNPPHAATRAIHPMVGMAPVHITPTKSVMPMQTPVAEGRYKRQQMTDGFGRLSGNPPHAATRAIHPMVGMAPVHITPTKSVMPMQTPVAEGRYKRQRVTDSFGRLGGNPPHAATRPIHPTAGIVPSRFVF